ncbi:GxxExxY protein [Azospirillum picis]|uniref:GxxExxY protein n=1 Tax=Azospirillum picis TaxID=488438 RepID=A0ABU0MLG6_9PROT|nr:GxxExxY protein [Azospirillum picis]MBP2300461.1 GxxExxY protein [Azospirillum picis]MDQ0534257.1 GxxExxY protein [Azospirillum picis]
MRVSLGADLDRLTERVIGAAFAVHTALGHGFAEQVYKKALLRELSDAGLAAATEVPFRVLYKGDAVGSYFADLVVERRVIVELKSCETLIQAHSRRALNCLRVSGPPAGLLFNFAGPGLTVKRVLTH